MRKYARKRLIVGITGLQGAGKSTAAQAAEQLGIPILVMGDFIRGKAEEAGLKPTPRNLGRLMLKLRREHGEDVVAKMTISALQKLPHSVVVIDGIRSLAEVSAFRQVCSQFRLIAIDASPAERFRRLTGRSRSDDTRSFAEFTRREKRELKVGVGKAIAAADRVIKAATPGELVNKTRAVLEEFILESRHARKS